MLDVTAARNLRIHILIFETKGMLLSPCKYCWVTKHNVLIRNSDLPWKFIRVLTIQKVGNTNWNRQFPVAQSVCQPHSLWNESTNKEQVKSIFSCPHGWKVLVPHSSGNQTVLQWNNTGGYIWDTNIHVEFKWICML